MTQPGMVVTVLGDVPASALGPTLMHEHLLCDLTPFLREPRTEAERAFAEAPVAMPLLGRLRYYPYSNRDNLILDNLQVAVEEVLNFKQAGGTAIVDATSGGIGRNPEGLVEIARATGVHIVMGSGYYIASVHPGDLAEKHEEAIADDIVREVQEGVGESGVRPGIIGEIGLSWPVHAQERTALRAAARAQRETGAPLVVHPGRNPAAPLDAVRTVEAAGGDLGRTVICHLCRTIFDWETLVTLARTGCYLEYDLFGQETSYYQSNPASDIPSDAQRMSWIRRLIDAGYGNRVLLSSDVANKHQLIRYGGYGYSHILANIVPRMRDRGFSEAEIDMLLVENPRRILAFT